VADDAPDLTDLTDDELLAELGDVLARVAGPPPGALEAAKNLFTWRTVDAELAALVFDSVVDEAAVATRSVAEVRTVTFEAGSLTIDLDVTAGSRLLGQLDPPQHAVVELRGDDGTVTEEADDLGRFTIAVPAGWRVVRLRCRLDDGTNVESGALAL
jgi:hypothetical protein